jgi:putative transposase
MSSLEWTRFRGHLMVFAVRPGKDGVRRAAEPDLRIRRSSGVSDLSDAWPVEQIKTVHAHNRGVHGSRRVTAELRLGEGVVVSPKRVQRLMRAAGLAGLTGVKRGRTTICVRGVRVADDLVERRFRPDRPDVLWVADITYLRTWEDRVYLAAV